MSYKPLSQTVTDGQKNPISSDAVNDHVAAEIAAIPASASLTLDNLTAPTAVNQDLNMGTNRLRFNSANGGSAISLLPANDVATGINAVTPAHAGTKTINTSSSIADVLQIGDVIYLNGLTQRAIVLTKPSDTQITVSPALGIGGFNASREIFIDSAMISGSDTDATFAITNDATFFRASNMFAVEIASKPMLTLKSGVVQLGNPTAWDSPLVHLEFAYPNNAGSPTFRVNNGGSVSTIFTFGSGVQFGASGGISFYPVSNTSQSDWQMPSMGFPNNAWWQIYARRKLQVGPSLSPYAQPCGEIVASALIPPITLNMGPFTFNDTTTATWTRSGNGQNDQLGSREVGIGGYLHVYKNGYPDILVRIEDTPSSSWPRAYVLSEAVSTDYNNQTAAFLQTPIVSLFDINQKQVATILQNGEMSLKPAAALEITKDLKLVSGNANISTLGKSLQIATGSNAAAGLATVANGTSDVTVSTNACGPNSIILVTNNTSDAHVSVSSKALGSFKIDHGSNVTGDQSCAWFIINPADVDAVSFLNTASITNSTQQSAILQLVADLKNYALWDKLLAIYPFVGGTATTHKYNLKNPAEYEITWNGTVTHDSNGITGNGTDGYGETGIAGSTLSKISNHVSVYSRTDSASTVTDIGAEIAAGGNKGIFFQAKTAVSNNPTRFANNAVQSSVNSLLANSQGLLVSTRSENEERNSGNQLTQVFFQNNIRRSTANVNSETLTFPETIIIGARKTGSSVSEFSDRNYAFATIGSGLTGIDVKNLYTAIQAFQTTLSRNV